MTLIDSVHALLFCADSPATADQIAKALETPPYEVEEALDSLGSKLDQEGPIQLVRIAGGYQLCTKSQFAQAVASFLQPQKSKLSRSLMEVLAIVAYKQPVTMSEVDAVRGVQSDYSLKQLVEKRMVGEVGRKETPGRPILYGTTQQFLHLFNMDTLQDLPEITIDVHSPELPGSEEETQPQLEMADEASVEG